MNITHDVIIIGGGAAGLAAATVLGRSRRDVVLIDAGHQSNKAAPKSHTAFTRDGESPSAIYEAARKDISKYKTVELKTGTVSTVKKEGETFMAITDSGEIYIARTLLLTQGTEYKLPTLPGIEQFWSTKVWHCPYCSGFEASDKKLFIYGSASWIEYTSTLLPQWSKDLTWSSTDSEISAEVREKIEKSGGKVAGRPILVKESSLGVTIVFEDKSEIDVEEIMVEVTQCQRDTIAKSLGCETTDFGRSIVDETGSSSTVDGLYIAGDQSELHNQVNIAVASGHKTAMSINSFLCRLDRDAE